MYIVNNSPERRFQMWKSEKLENLRDNLFISSMATFLMGGVATVALMATDRLYLGPMMVMPFILFLLLLSFSPLFVLNWRISLWDKREKKWREVHRTTYHVREAISSRSFGPRHYSDDAHGLFSLLLSGGVGPYFPATMEQAARDVSTLHANDGLSGLTELCMLGDVEFTENKWRWSDELWNEVWQYWLNEDPVGPWYKSWKDEQRQLTVEAF